MGIFKKKNKRQGLGLGIADHGRSPQRVNQQDSPEQQRVTRSDENAGQSGHQVKNSPRPE